MSTGPDVDEREFDRLEFLPQGRVAGRMVDGVDVVIDGIPAGRMAPRWERRLMTLGYDPEIEGPVSFAVDVDGVIASREVSDVRAALLAARRAVEAGHSPRDVEVHAVTQSGLSVSVVTGTPIVGMAIGAIEDPPITVIEGPSVLPGYAPGEKRPKRKRRRRRG
jgi:hypothetical protein